jgi:hypothetical protein
MLPSTVGVAIQIYERAERAAATGNVSAANYLYQAAVGCALRADGGEESYRR